MYLVGVHPVVYASLCTPGYTAGTPSGMLSVLHVLGCTTGEALGSEERKPRGEEA